MENDHIFSVDNTLVAKGLFIIAVLAHHLFSARSCIPRTWMLVEPWYDLAILGKVAVHGFFLLSGYGLMKSMSACPCSVLGFYRKVFIRTYAQFWPVFVLALIPLLFGASGMTFSVVWPSLWNFLLDALGLAHLVPGAHQYNPTWWFLSALLVMYAVLPPGAAGRLPHARRICHSHDMVRSGAVDVVVLRQPLAVCDRRLSRSI